MRNGAGLRPIDTVTTNAYALLLETRTGAHEGSKGSKDDGPFEVTWCRKGCLLPAQAGSSWEASEAYVAD